MIQTEKPSGDRIENEIRSKRLVRASTFFAFCLEVIPVEMNAISVLLSNGAFFLALTVKVVCLAVILLPLTIYIRRNGLGALKRIWGRVTVIAVVVAISLASDVAMVNGIWRH